MTLLLSASVVDICSDFTASLSLKSTLNSDGCDIGDGKEVEFRGRFDSGVDRGLVMGSSIGPYDIS